jgi:hypothetical protein
MAGFDGDEFGRTIVEAVNASIERSVAPLIARLDALEAMDVPSTMAVLERRLADDMNRFDEAMKRALDKVALRALVVEAVEAEETIQVMEVIADKAVAHYVKDIPTPKDGKDAADIDMDAVRSMIVEECKDIRAGLESTIGPEMQTALSVMVKEAVEAIDIPTPKDGKDADPVDLDALADRVCGMIKLPELPEIVIPELPDIAGMVADAVKAIPVPIAPELPDIAGMVADAVKAIDIPTPKDGKDADPIDMDAVRSMIVEEVKAVPLPDVAGLVADAVKAIDIPTPKDGKDADPVDMDAVRSMIVEELPDVAGLVADAVKAIDIPTPKDGKDADPIDMDLVKAHVDEVLSEGLRVYTETVKAIPLPQDGKSVTVDDVRPLIDDAVSKAVAQIPVPKDGRDGADVVEAIIGKDEHLYLTLSNGQAKDVGRVVGWDGVDCDFERVNQRIANDIKMLFEAQPKPRDGFGFDDLSVEYDGERTIKMVFQRGDEKKEFPIVMPVVLDRGVYSEGKTYDRGDSVTWAGSRWIAQKDGATEKPGTNGDWLLSVKRGQNGKDGELKITKPPTPVKLGDK